MTRLTSLLVLAWLGLANVAFAQVRVGDVTRLHGIQQNRVEGVGLVVGLSGTGDGSPLTKQMLANFLQKKDGLNAPAATLSAKDCAVVMVSVLIPEHGRQGSMLDVQVSSIEGVKSLEGGTLVETELKEGDVTYVVAGGSLIVGGFAGGGQAANVRQNNPTSGRVPGGGELVREIEMDALGADGNLRLVLDLGGAENARRIAIAINKSLGALAKAEDSKTVAVYVPTDRRLRLTDFIADIQSVSFEPTHAAIVIVNARNGVIVAGASVRVAPCHIQEGDLTIAVTESPIASQPAPFSEGETKVLPRTQVTVDEETSAPVSLTGETTVGDLLNALDAIGSSPRDQIKVLQELKKGGWLQGHLIVQ